MDLDNKFMEKLENISFKPIFILGFHRSGTSILYKILSKTKCFNPINAYHVIKYDELLHNYFNNKESEVKRSLNDFLINQGQMDRGIDRLQLSADFKEEYRFIFTNKYYKPWITADNLPLFIELCKKIQFISDNNKPLLLKNPYDFPNFMFIKEAFPNARFIFIHRDPIKMFNSNIKSINDLFKKKNHYTALLSEDYNKIVNNPLAFHLSKFYFSSSTFLRSVHMVRGAVKNTDYYLDNISTLDQKSYVYTRYENLCQNPDDEISKIMNFLKLKPEFKSDYSKQIKPRKTILVKELQILRPYILKKMEKYLTYCGYQNI